jgi:hypothetical protein
LWQLFVATLTSCTTSLIKNYSQLIARGASIKHLIGILVDTYLVVPCQNFKSCIRHQHKNYLDGKLTTISHKTLMTSAKCKFDWLKTKRTWGSKHLDAMKMAMTTPLIALKGRSSWGSQAQCHCK